jgi:outer membrane protein OmpA-like peptidoglycan-associated protein
MKARFLTTFFLLLIIIPVIFCQEDIPITKKSFKIPTKTTGFKEAWKSVKLAEEAYSAQGEAYKTALEEYIKAKNYNDKLPLLNYKLGVCYSYIQDYAKAYDCFKLAVDTNPKVTKDIFLQIGRSLHMQLKFNEAIDAYNKYKASLTPKELKAKTNDIDKFIEECKNGKDLVSKPVNVFVENLGSDINTEYADYYPVLSRDESKLYFTSRRMLNQKQKPNPLNNQYYEEIYVAKNVSKEWKNITLLGKPVNNPATNQVAVGTSYNDQILYIYKGSEGGGGIYQCQNNKGTWKKPKKAIISLNKKARETSMALSSDDKMLFIVSDDDEESIGGKDIYMMVKKKKDKWADPIHLGPTVNTKYDEEGIFLTRDGTTLYFSSKGHNSMGGYDIFKCTMNEKGEWGEPVNLGYPINTPGNDVFFSFSSDGRTGYFSSNNQAGGKGSYDIYKVTFLGPEKQMITDNEVNPIAFNINPLKSTFIKGSEEITTQNVMILKGTVKDAGTSNPIMANIEIVESDKNEIMSTSNSDSISGQYLVTLPAGKKYGISVSAKGYLFYSEYFDIPETAKYEEVEKDVTLTAIAVGVKLILKNIYFETGKSALKSESYTELGFAIKVFKDNPTIKIEVSGHTDNKGSASKNQKLSEERAKSVVDYLVSQGIERSRLTFKGYGYTQPVASNDTDEGRQQNRRVEFKITSE